MPNDSAGQFPSPSSFAPEEQPLTSAETRLTDAVAPDLSAPPTVEVAPQSETNLEVPRNPEYSRGTESIFKEQPASLPVMTPATTAPSRPFPVVTLLLLLVSVGAIAAAYFFYQQNSSLGRQLAQIEKTLEQQRIKEEQVITPTSTPEITVSPTSTASATPSATPTLSNEITAFGQIDTILSLANQKYPNAQLIMITATGAETASGTMIKYWFRQDLTTKKYLYVLRELGKDPVLFDQQVYVTPDNNIPSLNPAIAGGTLGLDLPEAIAIAKDLCPTTISCLVSPITAQYIKTTAPLWQISYKPINGSKPFVVQIDATSKAVLYKNQ